MLYRPEDFEPLTRERWSAARAREGIREIVADTEQALRGPKLLWRADAWDRWQSTSPLKNLYVGAAGVLWALDQLRRDGHAETRLDLEALSLRTLEMALARPDFVKGDAWKAPEPRESALFLGVAGVLLVSCRISPCKSLAEDLHRLVRENVSNEAEELMWGTPGTLLAAGLMHRWTREARWRDAARESAEALWSRRGEDGFWTQRLYGHELRGLTPPHGLVGIVHALRPHLDARRRRRLETETGLVLARTAVVEKVLANWPPRDRPTLPGPDGAIRLQWCAGAPGIVTTARDYLDEELLLAGAELVWRAGPHGDEKGASICHGTAGNGYALLAAFERTGDEKWLARARRFATHALEQTRRLRTRRGRGRYSLWTGDVGVAVYLAECLDATARYPVLDA